METTRRYFLGLQNHGNGDCSHEIKRHFAAWEKSYDKPRQCIKKQRHYFANKGLSSQTYGFSTSNVWMWMLDHKEGWAPNNWCFWTGVLEKTLESTLDSKEIKPVILKEINSEYSLEVLMLKLQYFWPPDVKTWLIGKDSDAEKDWRQEEEVVTNEMLDDIINSMDMSLSKFREMVKDKEAWDATVHGVTKSRTWWATEPQQQKYFRPEANPTRIW